MAEQAPKRSGRRWLVALVILVVLVVFCGGLALLLFGALASAERVTSGTVLELTLRGEIEEAPDPMSALQLPGLAGPPSLWDIRTAIDRAAGDDKVVALRIDVESVAAGWPVAEELMVAIDRFRAANKPVHAFLRGDFVDDLDYVLAAGADKVWLAPEAGLLFNGFQAEVTFWRGTLDKLGIEPQYFMFKEYKSAGEPMSRYQMSDAFRESIDELLRDLWSRALDRVAERRKLDRDRVVAEANRGLLTAAEAKEAGWVDGLGYEEDVRDGLRASTGADSYHAVSVRKYLQQSGDPGKGDKVALVFGSGVILSTAEESPFESYFSGPRVADAIRKAADDSSVKAILFRVDSPGGSAVGSDHVRRAVAYARKERNKPVVVSMGSVAASGGYWVSMGADGIVAWPNTVTGSIGVVFGKLNLRGLYQLVGANVDTVQVGDNADILSFVETMTPAHEERIKAWMTAVYESFKGHVAAGRNLAPDRVEEIARGRVWSGTDALDRGLVDRLGGYDEALALLRDKAQIAADRPLQLVVYPKPRTILDLLLSEDDMVRLPALLRARQDPLRAVELALGDLAHPGVQLLAPAVRLR
jgi:protease-4